MMGTELQTGAVTRTSKVPGTYNEVEGIFPDGVHTAVEAIASANNSVGGEIGEY